MADDMGELGRADLSNWRASPQSRWAFHHVDALIPTTPVRRGGGQAMPLPRSPKSLDAFALRLPSGASLDLDAFLNATATDALVVLLDGEVVHESYAHGMQASSLHILMSATKAVVGLTAGLLASAGRLDLDAPVVRHVPEVADGPYAQSTLRDLLDMRMAIAFDEAQQHAYDEATGWDPTPTGVPGPGLHAFFAGLKGPPAAVGGPFRYVSANTDLLGWAVERASGRAFADLLGELLWTPLGAEHDAALTLDWTGAPRCAGGLCASARDFARLGQLLVDGGRRDGAQVVAAAVLEDLARNGDREGWASGEWGAAFAPISPSMSYRDGWYAVHREPTTLFAMGIHGQNLFVDPASRLVVAKFSSWSEATDYRALPLTHMAVAEMRRLLTRTGS